MQNKCSEDKESQVNEYDLTPDALFLGKATSNEISSINESENDEPNNITFLNNIVNSMNKEIEEQERTIDLQDHQIKILKETIKDLERKRSFDKAYTNGIGPYPDHLKTSLVKLISHIPKLSPEGEALIFLIFSLLNLSQNELLEFQDLRSSKTFRNFICLFNDQR